MTLLAFAGLALPVSLGVAAGVAGLFRDPEAAIGHLNRFALYLAFPALIIAGLTDAAFTFPHQPWFWLVVPGSMIATASALRLLSARHPERAGTLAITGIFGNVAYVGLPLCVSVLGPETLGTTSLAVSLFVLCSLVLGPTLLVRWTPGASPLGNPWLAVLRQPLFWSPFVGLGLRGLSPGVLASLHTLVAPLGASAAPVALFLLGLYLWENRRRAAEGGAIGLTHVLAKMVLFPGLMLVAVLLARAAGWEDVPAARILVLLSTMPTAIATFALAQEFSVGRARVAQAIVGSTLLAAVILPFVVALVLRIVA